MKEKYCKIPKFRFNKFLESWERLKYEDVIEVNSGKDYKHLDKGDIPVYGTGGYMLSVSEAITDKDGVGIGRKGTINKPYILKAPYWTVDTLFFCIPKNKYNLYFINAIFERTQWERFDESTGVPSLSKLTINNIQNYFPSFNEQSAIGSLFRTLDDLLASYKDNLANYQSLKATMLSKMFPKAGQTVPEIRLDGFEGEWKIKRADEIFKSVSEKNRALLPVLSASQIDGMVLRDEIGIDIKYDEATLNNYKVVKPGQFVIHLRSFQGGFALSKLEGITSPAYTIIDFIDKKNHLSGFWNSILTSKEFIKRLETVTYGIRDGKSISFKDFSSLKFIFPNLEEQQAIGKYFTNLDNLITSYQEKISQLETLKKKLLQDMFI